MFPGESVSVRFGLLRWSRLSGQNGRGSSLSEMAAAVDEEERDESEHRDTLLAAWWPQTPTLPVFVDGSNAQAVGLVRAVANPARVSVGVKQRFYLGSNPCTAYDGRGNVVSATASPHPASKTHFSVFNNPAGYPDHSGYVYIRFQQEPTHQVYLEGIKPGKVIVRCHPAIRIRDGDQHIEVHLRRVFADILVEVL